MTHTTAEHEPLRQRVQASLDRQGMMQPLGVKLLAVAPGTVTLAMPYSVLVAQQQGGFHGGAMGALADIAGGYAALTVAPEGMEVTTVEYKINFLAAFQGSPKSGNASSSPPPRWCMWRLTASARTAR